MAKNLSSAMVSLEKLNSYNEYYDNIANSAIIEQENNKLKNKASSSKVSSGLITATGNNVIVSNVSINNDQKISTAINKVEQNYSNRSSALQDIMNKGSAKISTDNYKNYTYQSLQSAEVIAPTFVATDPDKPEVSNVTVQSSSSNFDINNLYSGTNSVNLYENTYSDNYSSTKISSDNMTSFSNEGAVVQLPYINSEGLPGYHFIPAEQIVQNTTVEKNDFTSVIPYEFKDDIIGQDFLHERTVNSTINSKIDTGYKYLYCLDGVVFENRRIVRAAGFISEPIKIEQGSYVELSAETIDGIEYSIIDGNEEVPILPKNVTVVTNEKLFFGMMPRFTIADSEDLIVKKNDIQIGVTTLRELEIFLMADASRDQTQESSFRNDNFYTITYKPIQSAQRYFPKNSTVKVKVIQRHITDNPPESIGAIKLLQSSGKNSWYLSSYEQDSDYNAYNPSYRR